MLKQFQDEIKVKVNAGDFLSYTISVENGVKQVDTMVPRLFALYFAIVFQITFEDCTEEVSKI